MEGGGGAGGRMESVRGRLGQYALPFSPRVSVYEPRPSVLVVGICDEDFDQNGAGVGLYTVQLPTEANELDVLGSLVSAREALQTNGRIRRTCGASNVADTDFARLGRIFEGLVDERLGEPHRSGRSAGDERISRGLTVIGETAIAAESIIGQTRVQLTSNKRDAKVAKGQGAATEHAAAATRDGVQTRRRWPSA